MILYTSRKAEMGMGTLIIFISLILVAAVAATVLVNTTSALQNTALSVGRSTQQEISTAMTIVDVYATDGQSSSVDNFYTSLRLAAGSSPIKLDDLLVTLTLHNNSYDYMYSDTVDCDDENTFTTSAFGAKRILNGTQPTDGYMMRGDMYTFCVGTDQSVFEGESLRISIIPKVGMPVRLFLSTPNIMFSQRIALYP